nr:uncharacterized mitochondrial protein AtMg00810-like [Tanacetum cinerariifolium]
MTKNLEEHRKELCNAFEKLMHEKFQMSSMGELTYFLGLQVKQKNDGIFISQDKYVVEILKKFRFIKGKNARTLMKTQKPLLKDEDGEEVEVHVYRIGKGFSGRITDLFPSMLVQNPMGEGSALPTDPQHTPTILQSSPSQPQNTQKLSKLKRKNTQVPQPSGSIKHVADEAVYKELDDGLVRAATTTSGLEVEQDSGAKKPWGIKLLKLGLRMCLNFLMIYFSQEVNVAGEVNAASIATTDSAAATITTKEITLTQALVEIKTTKPKAKGIILQEPSESPTTTTTIPKKKSHDKGKAIMIKEHVKLKKKDQIRLNEETALKLQAGFNEEEQRLARERAQKELEANIALIETWDDVQAKTDVDYQMAERLVNTFVDFRTELDEGSSKRAGEELTQESAKKQKVEDDKEIAKLNKLMEIIPDEEEVAIDAIPLAAKSPRIVDLMIYKKGKKSYYQIIRADGSSKMYMFFRHMLKSFNREDLYKMVKAKFRSTRPVEDLDLLLLGDSKTIFEPRVEDVI